MRKMLIQIKSAWIIRFPKCQITWMYTTSIWRDNCFPTWVCESYQGYSDALWHVTPQHIHAWCWCWSKLVTGMLLLIGRTYQPNGLSCAFGNVCFIKVQKILRQHLPPLHIRRWHLPIFNLLTQLNDTQKSFHIWFGFVLFKLPNLQNQPWGKFHH